jgi:hypothetical protein
MKNCRNYKIFMGLNFKSLGSSWTWPSVALLARFSAILAIGQRGEQGKRKRMMRGFDFIPYL